jgi:hypothetical protein
MIIRVSDDFHTQEFISTIRMISQFKRWSQMGSMEPINLGYSRVRTILIDKHKLKLRYLAALCMAYVSKKGLRT